MSDLRKNAEPGWHALAYADYHNVSITLDAPMCRAIMAKWTELVEDKNIHIRENTRLLGLLEKPHVMELLDPNVRSETDTERYRTAVQDPE